jgi:hypothetical protein
MATGQTTIDFGAFPGQTDATKQITGQTGIASGSLVEAWINPVDSADHSRDEHMYENIRVFAINIVAGTGFDIYAREDGPDTVANEGHRLYGIYNVNWAWV